MRIQVEVGNNLQLKEVLVSEEMAFIDDNDRHPVLIGFQVKNASLDGLKQQAFCMAVFTAQPVIELPVKIRDPDCRKRQV